MIRCLLFITLVMTVSGASAEELRSRATLLDTENQRLQDNQKNDAFINGGLMVALGVMIALLVPRLRPARRNNNSSWA